MATTPDIVPELAELRKPYVVPMPDPFASQTSAAVTGQPTAKDVQKIDVKALGKEGTLAQMANIRQQEADVRQAELASKLKIAEGEQQIADTRAKGQSEITRQESDRVRKIAQYETDFRKNNPAPELVPTKDNIQSLSTLFGLIGVIGMAMGGAGKQSATASLNAMGGMMKGYQQGRADLWKREVQEFDKNMLAWKAKLDDAIKKAEAAYKILPYDRAEAESKLNEVITSMGSALLKEKNRVQGFVPTLETLKELHKDSEFIFKEARIDDRHRETLAAKKKEEGVNLGQLDVNRAFNLGVPVSIQNPYVGLTEKQQSSVLNSEVKKAEEILKTEAEKTGKARATIDAMTEADSLNDQITTGKYGIVPGGEYAQTKFDSKAARFDSIAKDQARNAYVKGEGALSDMERKMFEKASISLGNPNATNKQIIKVTKEIAQRNLEHAEYLARYFGVNKTMFGAEENWNKYIAANPLFAKESSSENLVLNPNRKPYQQYFQDELRNTYGRQGQ
jgi:hypothetical protein